MKGRVSEKHTISARVPFAWIKDLVAREHIASLYEDYPTMGADMPFLDVTLTYEIRTSDTYEVKANEPRFWPTELRSFTSAIDDIVLSQLAGGRRVCTVKTMAPRN